MRTILMLVAAILVGGGATATALRAQSAQAKPAETTKVCILKVTGMTCSGCKAAVKIAAKRIAGVNSRKSATPKERLKSPTIPARHRPMRSAKTIAEKTGYTTEVTK